MALSSSTSWFHSWSPPSHISTGNFYHQFDHHQPVSHPNTFNWQDDQDDLHHQQHSHPTFTEEKEKPQTTNMANFIPYLLSLGLVTGEDGRLTSSPSDFTLHQFPSSTPERSGPFTTKYSWKLIDFEYPTSDARQRAITSGAFVPENNLPLGIEVYKDRMFVSMPKWKKGVPATLGVLPKVPKETSPKFVPYPSWEWHDTDDCGGLTSVYRMQADECGRLWVIDSGQIEVTIKPKQVCPPKLFIFDLHTDELLVRYPIPDEFIKQDSLYSNIKVDVRDHKCEDAHAYIADVWRFGLVVFSLSKMRSWRVYDHLFFPDPLSSAYNVHGVAFEWTDGIFGMALSPVNKRTDDRVLYFHPMSSFREFYVKTSVIRNETGWDQVKDAFKVLGQSRGKRGQASASAMDRNGVLFFNQVTRDSVGCWDSRKPYKRGNLGLVVHNNETLVFPNDMKIDKEARQSIWVISNRLPMYLYTSLDPKDDNFRIMSAYTDEAIKNTICDPKVLFGDSLEPYDNSDDCY